MRNFVKKNSESVQKIHNRALKLGLLYINDSITRSSLYTVYHQLIEMIADRTDTTAIAKPPIRVFINSPGGDASIGLTIAHLIALSPVPIDTRVVGEADSAAALIFLGGHTREVSPGSRLMLHYSSVHGMSAENSRHTKIMAKSHEDLDKEIEDFIIQRTKQSSEVIQSKLAAGEWYLSAKDAFEYGLATTLTVNEN